MVEIENPPCWFAGFLKEGGKVAEVRRCDLNAQHRYDQGDMFG